MHSQQVVVQTKETADAVVSMASTVYEYIQFEDGDFGVSGAFDSATLEQIQQMGGVRYIEHDPRVIEPSQVLASPENSNGNGNTALALAGLGLAWVVLG